MLFTLGNRDEYNRVLLERNLLCKDVGGTVWESYEDVLDYFKVAYRDDPKEMRHFDIYGVVDADWNNDCEVIPSHLYRALKRSAEVIYIHHNWELYFGRGDIKDASFHRYCYRYKEDWCEEDEETDEEAAEYFREKRQKKIRNELLTEVFVKEDGSVNWEELIKTLNEHQREIFLFEFSRVAASSVREGDILFFEIDKKVSSKNREQIGSEIRSCLSNIGLENTEVVLLTGGIKMAGLFRPTPAGTWEKNPSIRDE